MSKANVFLTVVILASLDKATVFVEHPQVSITAPAIFGKQSTPTPPGIYLVTRGYAKNIGQRVLIFRREGNDIWAVHPNLQHREAALRSADVGDNRLSGGCIGVDQKTFDKLWAVKQTMVLQVY